MNITSNLVTDDSNSKKFGNMFRMKYKGNYHLLKYLLWLPSATLVVKEVQKDFLIIKQKILVENYVQANSVGHIGLLNVQDSLLSYCFFIVTVVCLLSI